MSDKIKIHFFILDPKIPSFECAACSLNNGHTLIIEGFEKADEHIKRHELNGDHIEVNTFSPEYY